METWRLIGFLSIPVIGLSIAWLVFGLQPDRYEANVVPAPAFGMEGGRLFVDPDFGFEAIVPPGFSIDESYTDHEPATGRAIAGVAFIAPSESDKVSASPRAYAAVEVLADASCAPASFIQTSSPGTPAYFGLTRYLMAKDDRPSPYRAAYVRGDRTRCFAVKYSIPEGRDPALVSALDSITGSLIIY